VTVDTTARSISMTFSGTHINSQGVAQAGGVQTQTWTFTEPTQTLGQMTGAWVSPDHRRVWVFNYNNTTGMHAGVNGPMNFQDACYVFDEPPAYSNIYSQRGGCSCFMTLTGAALLIQLLY